MQVVVCNVISHIQKKKRFTLLFTNKGRTFLLFGKDICLVSFAIFRQDLHGKRLALLYIGVEFFKRLLVAQQGFAVA